MCDPVCSLTSSPPRLLMSQMSLLISNCHLKGVSAGHFNLRSQPYVSQPPQDVQSLLLEAYTYFCGCFFCSNSQKCCSVSICLIYSVISLHHIVINVNRISAHCIVSAVMCVCDCVKNSENCCPQPPSCVFSVSHWL